MWKFITLTSLTAIGFKLWTFLTVVGVLQELMLEIEPETSMRMSDLQPWNKRNINYVNASTPQFGDWAERWDSR